MLRRALPALLALFAAVDVLPAQGTAAPVLLEMRPMPDALDAELAQAARQRLIAWLDRDGHRELVQRMPLTIHFHQEAIAGTGAPAGKLRWYPHVLQPRAGKGWSYSFASGELKQITIPLFDAKVLDQPPKADAAPLVELVLVDVAGVHFTGADLAKASTTAGMDGAPCVLYELTEQRKSAYGDWSESLIRHHCAIAVNGMVTSAPVFESRIPGFGMIHGDFQAADTEQLCAGLQAALHHPWSNTPRSGAPQTDAEDPLVAIAHMVQLRSAKDGKLRRASAIALREYVDHPHWMTQRLTASLAAEQDAGVLAELTATVGMLDAEAKAALPRLRELEQHADKHVAQLAAKARQRIEAAVAGKR